MLNHLSAGAFQRFASHQDYGPIVRVVSIQITYFLKSAFGIAARWGEGVRIDHVQQVATDLLSKEICWVVFFRTEILSALQTCNMGLTNWAI
ncbi:hypothetical protein CDAR_566921 [Caerostris darwini]|uniref:Uncharacterized protein n=1 Tax=Caerostris darwini TaxID=1538125 RepID=A0AAV4PG89_9ARAC|nr:hypothetical protein CDAR_566921 [Caerostris darwini]